MSTLGSVPLWLGLLVFSAVTVLGVAWAVSGMSWLVRWWLRTPPRPPKEAVRDGFLQAMFGLWAPELFERWRSARRGR